MMTEKMDKTMLIGIAMILIEYHRIYRISFRYFDLNYDSADSIDHYSFITLTMDIYEESNMTVMDVLNLRNGLAQTIRFLPVRDCTWSKRIT